MVLRLAGFQRRHEYDTPAQSIYHRPGTKSRALSKGQRLSTGGGNSHGGNSHSSSSSNSSSSGGMSLRSSAGRGTASSGSGPDSGTDGEKNGPTGSDTSANPIIFVHGIGVGFVHYLGLIFSFPSEVDVYLVEWPHVAYQMSDRAPTIDETVGTMLRMLDDGGHEQVLIGWETERRRGRRSGRKRGRGGSSDGCLCVSE